MRNKVKIAGILLMLFAAGTLSLNAQRGMRGMRPDSAEMNWMKMQHRQMWQTPRGIRNMGMGPRMGMMAPGMGRPGMGMRQQAPGRIMQNIPDLTDKQKKDIADLRQKHQAEMQKLREEMQGKMKEMRESQRTKIMNLLTPEQQKWLEENTPKPLSR